MSRVSSVAGLLFVSGLCALVFQTAWLREFRLIFGSSTPASAAVLAIFMGGLGLGNALLGQRADRTARPLALYAMLELAISIACLASPFLVQGIRSIYIALGGQESLGLIGATLVRLALSALVLGLPTFLMGGTLPAAARAVTRADDHSRGDVGLLYGLNTLGAVVGAVFSTFWLLEALGTWATLCIACAANLLNATLAWRLAQAWGDQADVSPVPIPALKREDPSTGKKKDKKHRETPVPISKPESAVADSPVTTQPVAAPLLLYFSAGLVGFAFFLMEIVWYRMLGPILGGTAFTFGLILAVALAGIGIGGALYPWLFRDRRPDLRSFAHTLGWEALAIAIPFALGDRLAIFAGVLRSLAYYGFYGQVLGWLVIAGFVVFPAALVSGIQFPLLIGLIGQGRQDVGKQLGRAFAWNTVGAMLGSLAGGFGLLPLLSATGVWKLVVILLAGFALVILAVDFFRRRTATGMLAPLGVAGLAALCLGMTGPTAVWRHSGIGAGRARLPPASRNDLRNWTNDQRRQIIWQTDGLESSVGISGRSGVSFIVGGKSDGNAISDSGTQIMLGVLGAMLHPNPKEALVVGLGTGESAGWLASLPETERVEVVELEPAIRHVAELCSPLNHNVLHNPKVRIQYNDAREALQTTRQSFDLIASEPSNPYRSGVASLYTREFYQAARQRLRPGGIFIQWLQGYEIDGAAVRTVLTTLHSVFPHMEIWDGRPGDLLIVCSASPLAYDLPLLKRRVATPEHRQALRVGWRTTELEGFLAHFIAGERYVSAVASQPAAWVNTDNLNLLEYSFARSVGRSGGFTTGILRSEAGLPRLHGSGRPLPELKTGVNWQRVADHWLIYNAVLGEVPFNLGDPTKEQAHRAAAWSGLVQGRPKAEFIQHWEAQPQPPKDTAEVAILALAYADQASDKALPLIEQLRKESSLEANAVSAVLATQQKRFADATQHLEQTFLALRTDATPLPYLVLTALEAARIVGESDRSFAPRLFVALDRPFAVLQTDDQRHSTLISIARWCQPQELAMSIEQLEPFIPWDEPFLRLRLSAYQKVNSPRAARAQRDLADFLRNSVEAQVLVQ